MDALASIPPQDLGTPLGKVVVSIAESGAVDCKVASECTPMSGEARQISREVPGNFLSLVAVDVVCFSHTAQAGAV